MKFILVLGQFLKKRWVFLLGLVLVIVWCLPYFFTGNRIEWGDFSMFAQAYEAIRITITEYGQFPWLNPWMAAGTPLYANPQIGVFSIQTLLVLLFGSPVGLKISLILYIVAAYLSMYLLLRKYFKISTNIATPLSLVWITCSFFVAHLPSHYTFVWYGLAPLFIYLSLTLNKRLISGLLLGIAFAVMALSQVHNPFFHIGVICVVIIAVRLIRDYKNIKSYISPLLIATLAFVVIAGHRLAYTVQNALEFPRVLIDNAADIRVSILAFLLPYKTPSYSFIGFPKAPFGWQEITAYAGVGILVALIIGLVFILRNSIVAKKIVHPQLLVILGVLILTLLIGLGSFADFAPYIILKHLPIFSSMRVSSRWFIFTLLAVLILVGLVYKAMPKKSFGKLVVIVFVVIGAGELYISNFGYQSTILSHDTITSDYKASGYSFEQSKQFGSTNQFPDGQRIMKADPDLPHFYREYEATTYNIGTIQANDSLIDLNTLPTPRCGIEDGCNFVLTNNADVVSWSPQKIVLKRSSEGPIKLNMNNSSYFLINGHRDDTIRTAEAYTDFVIQDASSIITIDVSPPLIPKIVRHS